MDKNYIIFIIGYDWCRSLESMSLACDDGFELANALADKYLIRCRVENIEPEYQDLYDYINEEIDFKELCEELNSLIELQIAEYGDKGELCRMVYFKVTKMWLSRYLAEQFLGDPDCDMMYSSIEDFMDNYTSEEGREVYAQAVLENQVKEENYSE